VARRKAKESLAKVQERIAEWDLLEAFASSADSFFTPEECDVYSSTQRLKNISDTSLF
jgi:hypothetical protein